MQKIIDFFCQTLQERDNLQSNQVILQQELSLDQLKEFWIEDKHTLVNWIFEVKLKYSGELLFFASRNSPLLQNIFPGAGGEN